MRSIRACLLAALSAAACKPPFVLLAVSDPEGNAGDSVQFAIGPDTDTGERMQRDGASFPINVLITSKDAKDELLWVEALDASGVVVARGRVMARFRGGGTRAAVALARPCNTGMPPFAGCALPDASGNVGVCLAGSCRVSRCGDGYTDGAESCDDGNLDDSDDCTTNCAVAFCGDGHVHSAIDLSTGRPYEACDDGNPSNADGCLRTCVLNVCGDGQVRSEIDTTTGLSFEACDDGQSDSNANPNDGCYACRTTRWLPAPRFGVGNGLGHAYALLLTPGAVAVDDSDRVYFSKQQAVFRYDQATDSLAQLSDLLLGVPESISAMGAAGNDLFLTVDTSVWMLDLRTGAARAVAGGGSGSNRDGASPYDAAVAPRDLAVGPDGLAYVAEGSVVWRLDLGRGRIDWVAGSGTSAPSQGVNGRLLALPNIAAIAFSHAGDLHIAESSSRKIVALRFADLADPASASVTTVSDLPAGVSALRRMAFDSSDALYFTHDDLVARLGAGEIAGTGVSAADTTDSGPAGLVHLKAPGGIAVAGNTLYVTDAYGRVRSIGMACSPAQWWTTTIAGHGIETPFPSGGFFEDGMLATSSTSWQPLRVAGLAAGPSGQVYVLDRGKALLRLDPATLTVYGVAGTPGLPAECQATPQSPFVEPQALAVGPGDTLYVTEVGRNQIEVVSAGQANPLGPVLSQPGVLAAGATAVYVVELGSRIISRLELQPPNDVTAVTGGGTAVACDATLDASAVRGLAVDAAEQYLYATLGDLVCQITLATGAVTSVGPAGVSGTRGIAVDPQSGDLLLVETGNSRVWRFAGGAWTLFAGGGTSTNDGVQALGADLGGSNRELTDATVAAGELFLSVLNTGVGSTDKVRRVDAERYVETVFGSGQYTYDAAFDGLATVAALTRPVAIEPLDSGRWLVSDAWLHRLRLWDDGSGLLRSASSTNYNYPTGGALVRWAGSAEAVGAGLALVNDAIFSTVSGNALWYIDRRGSDNPSRWQYGLQTTTGPDAMLTQHMVYDSVSALLYFADEGRHCVQSLDLSNYSVATAVGTHGVEGLAADGETALATHLSRPAALAITPVDVPCCATCSYTCRPLFVAEPENHRVYRVTPDASGALDANSTIALVIGDGVPSSAGEGAPARELSVDTPRGLAVDRFGNLFIASANTVRVVTAPADGDSEVHTIYGNLGAPSEAFTQCLSDLALDPDDPTDGTIMLIDFCQGVLLRLTRQVN